MRRSALLVVFIAALVASAKPPTKEEAAAAWMKRNAVALTSAEAGHGFDDLEPVGNMVGNARLVALGEATHGTREFFQLKHRMLEYLVTKKGFTVFAMEASFPDAQAVNDYVVHGTGDPSAALAGLGFWTWDTDEVLAMIVWMRNWNAEPAHVPKLKFYGFDMQNPISSVLRLRAYIASPTAEEKAAIDTLAQIATFHRENISAEERQKYDEAVNTLAKAVDTRKSPGEAWELAHQQVMLIRQAEEVLFAKNGLDDARDRAMAVNVKWIVDHEPAGTKAVLWAHNGHVEGREASETATMGSTLRKWYGDSLVIFGFAFDHGEFEAVKYGGGGLQKLSVTAAPEGTLDAMLVANVPPLAALDLRGASGPARQWLEETQKTRSIGAVFAPDHGELYFDKLKPLVAYDVILFVAGTSAAHQQLARRPPLPPPDPKALNMAFEDGVAGQKPTGWRNNSLPAGYRAVTTSEGCASGLCVKFSRDGELTRPGVGVLMQRVDATPFRGKRVRFRAKVRSDIPAGSSARLWLRVDLPKGVMGTLDNMGDRLPGALPQWAILETFGTVPDDAEAIAFGMLFNGDGTAWMDEASLEVVQ